MIFILAAEIHQQANIVQNIKKQSDIPVLFPKKIVVSDKKPLYASAASFTSHPDYQQYWQINVDFTPNCQGVKTCNLGFISAEKSGKISRSYQTLPENKIHFKESIYITKNIKAYYTPFHIEAGAVNPTIEWKINNVLYKISWRIDADPSRQQKILIAMAQSVKNGY